MDHDCIPAEIQYETPEGLVHSDICFSVGAAVPLAEAINYRNFLHDVLDEWLDKSNGSGFFYIGKDIAENFTEV